MGMISYNRLWVTLKKKGISQYALIKRYHISPGQITRLKRNESVSTQPLRCFAGFWTVGWKMLWNTSKKRTKKAGAFGSCSERVEKVA